MRFRFVLPLANVILGVFLFHLGDLQVRRRVVAQGGAFEGMPDIAATARYVHYTLNAPAWVIAGDTREGFWDESTYWTGYDLRYFLAVITMWYLIGLKLDRRFGVKIAEGARQQTQPNHNFAWGIFFTGFSFVTQFCQNSFQKPRH